MNTMVQEICEFHFKMDCQMKDNLESLAVYKTAGNFSRSIVKILEFLCGKIENEHFFGEQRKSKYLYINRDLTIERESIHVYMPEGMYRQLKFQY